MSSKKNESNTIQDLDMLLQTALTLATESRLRAHAPYSKFHVGAVVITQNRKMFSGHNIENASYGGTVCAERVAIWNWASHDRNDKIIHLVLTTDPVAPPCGMCLQVMSEFFDETTKIHLATAGKIQKSISFNQLLPIRFDPASLP